MERGLDKSDIKVANRKMIMNQLVKRGPMSRIQLAKLTGMSPTSMTRIVDDLCETGLITEREGEYPGRGRKSTMLTLHADAFYALGIDVERSEFRYCIMNNGLEELEHFSFPHNVEKNADPVELVEECYIGYQHMLAQIQEQNPNFAVHKIKLIGVSYPGPVDTKKQVLIGSPVFVGKQNEQFKVKMEMQFGLPVTIENDVKASICNVKERYREMAKGSVAYVYLDRGIGTAFMYEGKVIKGNHFGAGEIAYITMPFQDHYKDRCEYYFSHYLCQRHLLNHAKEAGVNCDSIESLGKAYELGQEKAVAFCKETGRQLAYLLNLIVCMYNPTVVMVGGQTMQKAPFLLDLALENKDVYFSELLEDNGIILSPEKGDEPLLGGAVIGILQWRNQLIEEGKISAD